MFTINVDAVNIFKPPIIITTIALANYDKWRVDWYHRSGGDVNSFALGSENCPIESFKFEENLKLMGAADINLAYIDFLIHSDDTVDIYYGNDKIYHGIVDEEPEPKGFDSIKLIPRSQLLDEAIIDISCSNLSAQAILSLIIAEVTARTGINWNDALINTGESDLYTIDFNNVTAKKAIDTMVDKLDNRYWGVDVNNNFRVYTLDTEVTAVMTDGDDQWYSKIKRKYNYGKVKATRYQCLKKGATSGQQDYVGQVGYDLAGGSYPTLAIEKLKRRIEDVFTVSEENVTDAFVLDLAYSKLTKNAVLDDTITINDVRIDKVNEDIGTYFKVIDSYERQLVPFLDSNYNSITSSVTNWTGATLYTDDYVNGTGCIQMAGSNPTNSAVYYDFGEILHFVDLQKICFMAYSDEVTGNVVEVSLSDTLGNLFNTNYQILFNNSKLWEAKYIQPTETSFRYIGFRMNYTREITRYSYTVNVSSWNEFGFPSLSVVFRLGDIRWFGYGKQEYKGNLVKKTYKVDKKGEDVTFTLNSYELQANDDFFRLNKELEKIKDVQKT